MTSPVKSRCVMGTGVGDGATAIVDVVDGASMVAGSALELLEHAADASTIAAIVQVSSVMRICAQLYTKGDVANGNDVVPVTRPRSYGDRSPRGSPRSR